MKTYTSATSIYSVTQREDGTLYIVREYIHLNGKWVKDGNPMQNAGMFINQQGGIDAVLAKCDEEDNLHERVAEYNAGYAARKAAAEERERKRDEERAAKAKEEYDRLFCGEVTESTQETIGALLRYLNTQNWGLWNLPKMTIGYACHQYDCDGKTATTIKLDKPIMVYDEPGTMFQVGAPHGHLNKYRRI